MEKFISDFMNGNQTQRDDYLIEQAEDNIMVRFDPSHLHQILTNLAENASRHTEENENNKDKYKIEFYIGVSENNHHPFLDIIDHGTGIDKETAEHIFEPFYTTADTGTGLGLYISRELAECNQAHLTLLQKNTGGSYFRLMFSDPRRQMH